MPKIYHILYFEYREDNIFKEGFLLVEHRNFSKIDLSKLPKYAYSLHFFDIYTGNKKVDINNIPREISRRIWHNSSIGILIGQTYTLNQAKKLRHIITKEIYNDLSYFTHHNLIRTIANDWMFIEDNRKVFLHLGQLQELDLEY